MNSSLSPDSQQFEPELPQPLIPVMAVESTKAFPSSYHPDPLEIPVEMLTPRGETLFRRGVEALRDGESDEALEIWRRARAEFPKNAIIVHNLGLAEFASGQYRAAIQSFSRAHELNRSLAESNTNSICADAAWTSYKTRSDAVIARCEELRGKGRPEEAEALASQLLDEYPGSAAAHAELSINFSYRWSMGPMDDTALLLQALEYAQRSIFLDPIYPEGFAAASMAQNRLGMQREAYQSLEQRLKLLQEISSDSLLDCGEMALQAAHAENNDLLLAQKAADYADRVIAEEPDNLRAWFLRAQSNAVGVARGVVSVEDNLADFESLLELDPDNASALEARDFLRAQSRDDEISSDFGPVFDEALGYLEDNENEKALPLLRSILESEPDNRPTLNSLSLALRRLKRLDEALPVQIHLAEVDSTPESWRLVASIAVQLNRVEEANKAYIEVARLSPDDARAHSAVATTLEQLGRKEESIPYWRRVIGLTPHDDVAWFHLGENLLESARASDPADEGLMREALPALKRAYALDTEHVEALKHMALAHAELGEADAARDCASRFATHEPQSQASLLATLTSIHSRRLAEGLASRPSEVDYLPPILPPLLPVENAVEGEQIAVDSFSTVATKSLSPLLVGIVGLVAIFGVWVLLRTYFPLPPKSDISVTTVSPAINGGIVGDSARPPSTVFVPPSSQVSPPIDATAITGWWQGTFGADTARLLIKRGDFNDLSGTLYIDSGPNAGLEILVKGTLYGQTISLNETQILANPNYASWGLGHERGTLTQNGSEMKMSGTGTDTNNTYPWTFSRSVNATNSSTSTPNQEPSKWVRTSERNFLLNYPIDWTRSVESVGRQVRVSFNAPHSAVRLVTEVSPSSGRPTLSSWEMESESLSRTYGTDYQLLNLKKAFLGGESGATWEFVLGRSGEKPLRKMKRGVVHNGLNYELSMVAPAEEFNYWLPTFDHILGSFSFDDTNQQGHGF